LPPPRCCMHCNAFFFSFATCRFEQECHCSCLVNTEMSFR
jgi:hypothetical protein